MAINYNSKGFVGLIKFNTSNAVRYFPRINSLLVFTDQCYDKIINKWFPDSVWPPEFRINDLNINIYIFLFKALSANNFILIFNDNFIVSLDYFRNIQRNGKVNNSFFFTDKSISGPYIVNLEVLK